VALDAYREVIERNIPIADTGDVERDLADLLRSAMILSGSPDGRIFGQFLAETQCDPDFCEILSRRFLEAEAGRDSGVIGSRREAWRDRKHG